MLNRPKIVNLTIESYLLHVIYRLLGNARGFAGAILCLQFCRLR